MLKNEKAVFYRIIGNDSIGYKVKRKTGLFWWTVRDMWSAVIWVSKEGAEAYCALDYKERTDPIRVHQIVFP